LTDLEERRAWVEQAFDTIARQQLAPRRVALAALLVAAQSGRRDVGAQPVDERAIVRSIGAELVAIGRKASVENGCAHTACLAVRIALGKPLEPIGMLV